MKKNTIMVYIFVSIFFLSFFVNIFNVKSVTIIDVHHNKWSNYIDSTRRACIDSNGYIYAIYAGLNDSLFSEKSMDGGLTWGTKRWIPNPGPGYVNYSKDFDIVVDSNDKLWVSYFWRTDTNDANYIRVVNSTDGGETWGNDVSLNETYDIGDDWNSNDRLSMTVHNDDDVTIAFLGDSPVDAHQHLNIHHLNSITGIWSELHIDDGWYDFQHDIDCTALSNDTVVICYSTDVGALAAAFYYFYYYPNTNTNSSIYALYDDTTTNCGASDPIGLTCVCDNNDIVHITYSRDNGTYQGIFYKNLTNGVLSSEEEILSDAIRNYQMPSIGWSANGDIDVLFKGGNDCGANGGILYSEKSLGGTWSNVTYASFSGGSDPNIIYNRYPNNALLMDGFRFVYYQRNDTTANFNFTYADCSMFYWCDINCTAPECNSYNLTPLGKTITINVYNESNASQGLTFTTFISNNSGSETYYHTGCTNPYVISMTDSPTGDDTMFTITSDGYYERTFYIDIDPDSNYIINVYLAPINEAYIYCLIVINEYNEPVDDVKMVIQRYMYTTEQYENMSILYTDGVGQVLVYLIPDTPYKVTLSKTGYYTKTEDYIPDPTYYGIGYPKYFKIHGLNYTQIPEYNNRTVYFDVTMNSNSSLYLWHNTSICGTNTVQIYIYEHINYTTSLNGSYNYTTCNYSFYHSPINTSRIYSVYFYQNFTDTLNGNFHYVRTVGPLGSYVYNKTYLETEVTSVYGVWGPGYVNFFLLFLPFVIIVTIVGYVERGLGAMFGGFYLAFANSRIEGLGLINIYEISAFCFAIGLLLLLVYWRRGKT